MNRKGTFRFFGESLLCGSWMNRKRDYCHSSLRLMQMITSDLSDVSVPHRRM